MASRSASGKMDYERVFQALGRVVEEQRMTDIVLMEFEEGMILQGYKLVGTTEGWMRTFETRTFSREDLNKLVKDL